MAKTSKAAAITSPLAGLELFTAADGKHYGGRENILFARMATTTRAAAVFTQSTLPAWPVLWSRAALAKQKGRMPALLVNAGNANAANGKSGEKAVAICAKQAALLEKIPPEAVMLASTGIIGEPLRASEITAQLKKLRPASLETAASAIMTTDSHPKTAKHILKLPRNQGSITLLGIAKGAAMLAPNMATMLAFIFTDARLPTGFLQSALQAGLDDSFNAISVDGDTSTNDMTALFATGAKPLPAGASRQAFTKALHALMQDLALQLVRDGEGAKKLIETQISGAPSNKAARQLARSIGESLLVKTAIAGADPNWGRILMATGKAGVPLKASQISLKIGAINLFSKGEGKRLTPAQQKTLARHLRGKHVVIQLKAGQGKGEARLWSSDLTQDYVRLNADYRT